MVRHWNHISEEALERYAMMTMPRCRTKPVEQHLHICLECQDRLEATTDFLTAMRGAAEQISETKRKETGVGVRVSTTAHSR